MAATAADVDAWPLEKLEIEVRMLERSLAETKAETVKVRAEVGLFNGAMNKAFAKLKALNLTEKTMHEAQPLIDEIRLFQARIAELRMQAARQGEDEAAQTAELAERLASVQASIQRLGRKASDYADEEKALRARLGELARPESPSQLQAQLGDVENLAPAGAEHWAHEPEPSPVQASCMAHVREPGPPRRALAYADAMKALQDSFV